MKKLFYLVMLAAICGCERKKSETKLPQASVVISTDQATVTGDWTATFGIHYYLFETNGLIDGVVTFQDKTPPHRVQGLRSGNRVELFYEVAHAKMSPDNPKYSYTNYHSYEMRALLDGSRLNGFVFSSAGIGRSVTNWQATRIHLENPTMPQISEAPVVEIQPPYQPDPETKAALDKLKRSAEDEEKAWSNLQRTLTSSGTKPRP